MCCGGDKAIAQFTGSQEWLRETARDGDEALAPDWRVTDLALIEIIRLN